MRYREVYEAGLDIQHYKTARLPSDIKERSFYDLISLRRKIFSAANEYNNFPYCDLLYFLKE